MSHKLKTAFMVQVLHCENLGSPLMARWCKLFAERLRPSGEVGTALFAWRGDVAAGGDNLPLRLMGALHHLVITKRCPELMAVYPPHFKGKTDEQLWAAANTAFENFAPFILRQLKSAPQTNEVRRSAILLPGFLEISRQTDGLPFVLSELGASAGLNMNWDRYHYKLGNLQWGDEDSPVRMAPDWSGSVPERRNINIIERVGCDLNPTDLSDQGEVDNLLSYLWADQKDRLARTRSAINIMSQHPAYVEKMDAVKWLKTRLAHRRKNAVHIIYHTIAWQYFPKPLKDKGRELILAAGAQANASAPLAWLSFEADGKEPGAALSLTLWPSGKTQTLARADYHGRWINWLV